MKILITGGHVTPALAVIDELKGQEVVFVGRKYAVSGETKPSFEYEEVIKKGIKFIDLQAGRFTRILSLKSLINLLRIPLGFFNAKKIIKDEKPDRILTFGGYLAYPIAWWGNRYKIPIYTHEQTIVPGSGNKKIAKFAKKIFVAFPDAANYFPQDKVVVSGNPIRKMEEENKIFEVDKNYPTILIVGGSLGSHSVNKHVKNILKQLLEKYNIIHQTGSVKGENDFDSLTKIRNQLSEDLKSRYFLKEHFFEEEYTFVTNICDIVVGRAGANTFFELIEKEKPAVFIPLPWAAGGEQKKQAEIFAKAGCGEVFEQKEPSEVLLSRIEMVMNNLHKYKSNFRNLKNTFKPNAARFIAQEIVKD